MNKQHYPNITNLVDFPEWKTYQAMLSEELANLNMQILICPADALASVRDKIVQTQRIINLPKNLIDQYKGGE